MAFSHGYVIQEFHEVWHHPASMTQLFADYINLFVGLKVHIRTHQSTSVPSHIRTDKQREDFVTEFFESESVRLDPTKIVVNAGLRQLAKLCFNSFWEAAGSPISSNSTLAVAGLFFLRHLLSGLCDRRGFHPYLIRFIDHPCHPRHRYGLESFTTSVYPAENSPT
ncbi:hypothetical protein BV898_02023 [Hypsibius exemplaris]|uniref:Uncharacterized protein n=1 Tax=Hypsibius exemplaris TaxID=2072580 RepID=A0A1W0X959_HYPEX|nr:hypothetical protein BV898_02023 [Hypsibius exemplaris]